MASLDAFKNGDVALLVCSDVAARGLDIPDVSHVFKFDIPTHAEDYVHRIGRAGRAGKSGVALSLVTSDDTRYISDIEKLIGGPIEWIGGGLDSVTDEGAREHGGGRGRPGAGRGRPPRGDDRSRESAARAEKFAGRPPRKVEAEGEEVREARPPREERPVREHRPRPEAAPRPPREEHARPPREDRAARPPREEHARPPREENRHRRPERDDDHPVVGMGDHVPSFLMRPTKFVKSEKAAVEE